MIILVTGGSGCGKSTYAEQITTGMAGPYYYIAAMKPYDEECLNKIARHRRLRADKGFTTIEQHTDIDLITNNRGGSALLECMCNLTANEMFDDNGNFTDPFAKIMTGIRHLKDQFDNLVIVTNDVGNDCRQYDPETCRYIETIGKLNCALAAMADCVVEVVCGIPLPLKGNINDISNRK